MSSKILQEHNPEVYIEAINRSWNCFMAKLRSYPHYEFRDTPELSTMACSLKVPVFNRVTSTSLTKENVEQVVAETIQYFKQRKVPFTWQVNPWDTPSNLGQVLVEAGLKGDFSPGMAIKLSSLKEPTSLRGFTIKIVSTPEEREQYAWLFARAYGFPEEAHQIMVDMYNTVELTDDLQLYIGYLDGEPVSTTCILYDCGVAGIYNVATMPEARGKGMGSMITIASLLDAKKRGYAVSILHSSQMGYNLYKRLGFKEFCTMNRWEWYPT